MFKDLVIFFSVCIPLLFIYQITYWRNKKGNEYGNHCFVQGSRLISFWFLVALLCLLNLVCLVLAVKQGQMAWWLIVLMVYLYIGLGIFYWFEKDPPTYFRSCIPGGYQEPLHQPYYTLIPLWLGCLIRCWIIDYLSSLVED